ncbi:MAG: twitching motility protein PilT [Egibacteraceae bacterium]
MALTLDAGALIAVDRGDRRVHALLKLATRDGWVVTVPAPVIGQVWRDGARQARLARALDACRVEPTSDDAARAAGVLLGKATGLDACRVEPTSDEAARAAGVLLGKAAGTDVIDALVVMGAARRGDEVLTSDPADLAALAAAHPARVTLTVI